MKRRARLVSNRILNIIGIGLLLGLPLYFYNDYRSTQLEASPTVEPIFEPDEKDGVNGVITIGPNGVENSTDTEQNKPGSETKR